MSIYVHTHIQDKNLTKPKVPFTVCDTLIFLLDSNISYKIKKKTVGPNPLNDFHEQLMI